MLRPTLYRKETSHDMVIRREVESRLSNMRFENPDVARLRVLRDMATEERKPSVYEFSVIAE
jgi:hypothetical protein